MNIVNFNRIVLLLLAFSASPVLAESVADVTPYLQQSRESVKALGTSLKQKLISTMKSAGPEAAIAVCNVDAVPITNRVSVEMGVKITRTSLKNRNPGNSPSIWERRVLSQFEERKDKGESLSGMDFSEIVSHNGLEQFRYMKAIGMERPCLTCHGSEIAPDLSEVISLMYPDDKATGYSEGEFRGAFSVTIPLDPEDLRKE